MGEHDQETISKSNFQLFFSQFLLLPYFDPVPIFSSIIFVLFILKYYSNWKKSI